MIYSDTHSIDYCVNSLDILTQNLEETKVYHDSLASHFHLIFHYPDLDIKTSGYASLASIGMDLISDNHLRSEIGKFYTYTLPATRMAFHETRDDFYHYMLDFQNTEFETAGNGNNSLKRVPVNYEALTNNTAFIESIRTYKDVFMFYRRKAIVALNECKKLHQEVEEKLKTQ